MKKADDTCCLKFGTERVKQNTKSVKKIDEVGKCIATSQQQPLLESTK